MALDFPTSPSTGQKFPVTPTQGVPTYTWDGEKWTTYADAIAGELHVKKSGDTMTGALTINPATGDAVVALNPTQASQQATIGFYQGGTQKWQIGKQTNDGFFLYAIPGAKYALSVDPTSALATVYGDPTAALGVATKQYTDTGDGLRVLKTGDLMSGSLNLSHASPSLIINKPTSGSDCAIRGKTNMVSRWDMVFGGSSTESGSNTGSDFALFRYADNGSVIDTPIVIPRSTGQINLIGPVSIGSGQIYLANKLTLLGQGAGASTILYNTDGTGCLILNPSTDQSNYYRNTTHRFQNLTGSATSAIIDGSGVCAGVDTTSRFYGASNQTTVYVNGGTSYMNYTKSNGWWNWVTGGAAQMEIQWPVAMNFYGAAYKPGGGSWGDNSDIRIKNVTGEFKTGLEEVSKLRPVSFTFKGNDTSQAPDYVRTPDEAEKAKASKDVEPPVEVPYPNSMHYQAAKSKKLYHGFIAQEVESVFPEMVTKRRGYIDGVEVDDSRDLDTTPLIIALVNCVKELKARIEVLEGG